MICAFFASLSLVPLRAQHWMNDAQGQWTNSAGGTLRLRASTGELRNTNANLTNIRNYGTIELLGATNRFTGAVQLGAQVASRIGGLVRYTSGSVSLQTLQPRYYSNLDIDGTSSKRVPDGIYVGGDSATTGRFTARGGARLYEGTLYFDNTASQVLLGGESYQNIEIQRGVQPKRVELGANVTTLGEFRQNPSNGAGLQVLGILNIGTNADFPATPNFRGNIEIGTVANITIPGAFNVGAGVTRFAVREVRVVAGSLGTRFNTGEILVQTGATLRLNDLTTLTNSPAALGAIRLTTASHTLRVSGNLRNDRLPLDNTFFDPQSTVIFNARLDAASVLVQTFPQEIMRTSSAFPYGNLQCEFSDKIIASSPTFTQATISLAGNFRMNGGILNVARNTINPDSIGIVQILNPEARVEYSALAEVRGSVRRIMSDRAGNYVFNNATTRFLATSPNTTLPAEMTMTILQGVPPLTYEAASDVRRRILCSYRGNPNSVWQGNLQLGYRASEITSPFQTLNESYLSFFASPIPTNRIDTVRRIATTRIFREAASVQGFGVVEQFAVTNAPASLFRITSGEEIILRGQRELVRSVQDGRWSNPLTWNVLRQPDAGDSVEVRHAVHCGFRRNAIDGTTLLGQVRERAAVDSARLAAFINIVSATNATFLLGSVNQAESGFADEQPPTERVWNAAQTLSLSQMPSTIPDIIPLAGRTELLQIRINAVQPYQGVVLFPPASRADSIVVRVGSIQNSGVILNGATLETAQTLISSGQIWNAGTLVQRGEQTSIRQREMGGWTRFVGDTAMKSQILPALTFSKLALTGRSEKIVVDVPPIVVQDSLYTEGQVSITLPADGEVNIFGGMLHNGRIFSPQQSSLVRLNGTMRQQIQGFGTMDGLAMENPRGVEVVRNAEIGRGLVLRSRLNLTQGVMQLAERATLLLEDNVLISRRAESSLSAEPLRVGRVRVQTLGSRAMTATGELPTDSLALSTLSILNAGSYTLTKPAYILDSLTVASKLIAETADVQHIVHLRSLNTRTNPTFLTDSAEIIGSVRRTVSPDTLTRLFNNRFASLKLLNPNILNAELLATMRTIPRTAPEPNADTTKIRRTLTLDLARTENAMLPAPLLARIGYAWRSTELSTDPNNETNNLETPRIALQNWLPAASEWRTVGVPFRPTIRSQWNRPSESGFWQAGAMDSVRFGNANPSPMLGSGMATAAGSRFFALGVDSALSVLPSAFLSVKVFLEGAYQPAYLLGSLFTSGRMRTLLAEDALVPRSFDSSRTAQFGSSINARVTSIPKNVVDWLLVEVRPLLVNDSALWIPALLRSDGQIISADAQTSLRVELPSDNESFQVFLHHRNHTSLAFAESVRLLPASRVSLDFTNSRNLANAVKSARVVDTAPDGVPILAMRSGDVFGIDGAINRFDYDALPEPAWNLIFGQGYRRADADLNGIITTKDLNRIWNNRTSTGAIRKP
jgi:hypothetical protein